MALCVMPYPWWCCFLWWNWRIRRTVTWLFLGKIKGCLISNGEAELYRRPPTLSRPSLSTKGSSLWMLLLSLTVLFLFRAFWQSSNWSSLPSRLLRIFVSDSKWWCWRDFSITRSAWESIATKGGPSLGRQSICLFGRSFSIALCRQTIHLLRRLNEEKWLKRSGSNTPGKICLIFTLSIFVTSVDAWSLTSLSEGSNVYSGCDWRGSGSCCHRNCGPLNQRLLSGSSFAFRPHEALSAGFSFPGTWNQSSGELRCQICCTRLPT